MELPIYSIQSISGYIQIPVVPGRSSELKKLRRMYSNVDIINDFQNITAFIPKLTKLTKSPFITVKSDKGVDVTGLHCKSAWKYANRATI